MKNIKFFVIIFVFVILSKDVFAQSQNAIPEPSQWVSAPYRLYRTQNMWAFIELETATGRMWQVHFDTRGDNRARVVLSTQDRSVGRERIDGRFTLHPTQNIQTFILHDQIDGRTWQVQWSNESRNRIVIPISD